MARPSQRRRSEDREIERERLMALLNIGEHVYSLRTLRFLKKLVDEVEYLHRQLRDKGEE